MRGRHFSAVHHAAASAEPEADAMHRLDRVGAAGRRQLGADVADVAVDGAVGDMDVGGVGWRPSAGRG